jgi:pantoate kinase
LGDVVSIEDRGGVYRVLVGTPEEKIPIVKIILKRILQK